MPSKQTVPYFSRNRRVSFKEHPNIYPRIDARNIAHKCRFESRIGREGSSEYLLNAEIPSLTYRV